MVEHPGRGLADVVQERGEGEREAGIGGQELEHQHRVVPEVPLGLHRLALEQPLHRHQGGQDGGDEARVEGQVHGLGPALVHEHSPQLLGDPLGGDGDDLAGHRLEGRQGRRLDLKLEPRRQPDRAEHAELVLAEPGRGVADGAEEVILQVRLAPDVVDQLRPVSGSRNIPLIVKSRRAASSSGELKTTDSGRRPST